MGHESQIELWSPNLTTFCFVGFGTDRLRREQAMKTADRENPIHGGAWPRNRLHGAVGHNRSRSIEWAEKQEKFRPKEMCFFLTSSFIELIGSCPVARSKAGRPYDSHLATRILSSAQRYRWYLKIAASVSLFKESSKLWNCPKTVPWSR